MYDPRDDLDNEKDLAVRDRIAFLDEYGSFGRRK